VQLFVQLEYRADREHVDPIQVGKVQPDVAAAGLLKGQSIAQQLTVPEIETFFQGKRVEGFFHDRHGTTFKNCIFPPP
jgi:hypothetical protein